MDRENLQKIGRTLLPYLESLVLARKQARLQFDKCAGEYKNMWLYIIRDIDVQILNTRSEITRLSPLDRFTRQDPE